MTGEEERVQQNGNTLLVGLKLDSSGRELLTWTLAKFTQTGDRVIAVHAAAVSSQAGLMRSRSETTVQQGEDCFDSLIAAYGSICSIKQVDLQLRVANGSSLRLSLIEECTKNNAAKLILGHAPRKLHTGHSFSLAKYCARRLPSTCSVVVIEHGQITFEKEGSLKSLGENRLGVLNALQRTIRNRSWKNLGHHHPSDDETVSNLSKWLEVEMGPDEHGNAPCPWPLPHWFLDSPVSVLCPHKHPSFNKRALGPLDSPLSVLSFPDELGTAQKQAVDNLSRNDIVQDQPAKVGNPRQSLEECFALTERYRDNHLCFNASDNGMPPQSTQAISLKPNEKIGNSSCTLHGSLDAPIDDMSSQVTAAEDDNQPSVGWPLLRKHSITKQQNHKLSVPHKLSVVEWAMQLPDRPKEVANCQGQLLGTDYQTTCHHISSKSMYHEQKKTEEHSNDCDVDPLAQLNTDALGSRLAKLSSMRPCKVFQFKELQAATNNFDSEKLVGRGGCSQVYQGLISEDCKVAVKCLNAAATDSKDDLFMEVEIMCSLSHNHIVQLIGYCVESEHHMLVYNFASEGNLEQKLHGGKGKALLPWDARYKIAVGVADALNYLHDCCTKTVIHRDVKSSNILLSADLYPQLTDFGLAKWMPASSTQLTCSDVVGTFGYLAPEYFMFGKVSEKTDVYSFGVVLLELITGRRPIDNTRPKGETNLVAWARSLWEDESSAAKIVDTKLEGCYDFGQLKNMMIAAALCLRQSPQTRPRMSRVLKLLIGEVEDPEQIRRQDSVCKEFDDGCEMPNYEEIDIRTHLNLALFGLDDDAASQASTEHSVSLAHSNKYLEEYLGGRYSRSNSFE